MAIYNRHNAPFVDLLACHYPSFILSHIHSLSRSLSLISFSFLRLPSFQTVLQPDILQYDIHDSTQATMQLSTILLAGIFSLSASAQLTYTISKAASPSADETDAYAKIASAMDAAIARHVALGSKAIKTITVEYNTGVGTADGAFNGNIRFGADRAFMTERTALHEISHTLGVGTSSGFAANCAANNWPTATPLLQSFDGGDATIGCGGAHFWPYGLNYEDEMSDVNADRHVEMLNAMVADGMGN